MVFIITLLIIILIISYLLFAKIYFLRAPKRIIPKGKNIISPANGKIVSILKVPVNNNIKIRKGLIGKISTLSKFLGKKEGVMVSIMMNINNIHVQRAPVSGKVVSIKHNPGKFVNAVKDAEKMRWIENENIETIINNKEIGKVKIIQIAGLLARRCVSLVKPN